MNTNHLMHEQPHESNETLEGSRMELTQSQKLVKQLKEIKEQNEITYIRIMDMMEAKGKSVSLSTLRRVFSSSSDPNSFSYENTLLPIADVLLNIDNADLVTSSPLAAEVEKLKAIIQCQNEELTSLYDTKAFLKDRVQFMQDQIKLKDAMIKMLMSKVLGSTFDISNADEALD